MHSLIFKLGIKSRNPSLLRFYRELVKTDSASLEELKSIQENKFKELIDFAFNYSPYYKKKLNDLNIVRDDINSVDDLVKLPILEKDELRDNAEAINSTFKFNKVIVSETSGTSGQPLKFIKDEEWDSMNRASMYRGYSWYGVNPWDKNGYFWGYNISGKDQFKIKLLDVLQNRFRIFSYNENEIIKFTKKLKSADYIEGYSSMIYEVAKRINSIEGIQKPKKIKLIKGTSEKIYDNYHSETIKAFGSKIRSEYGAAEAGLIAFECPEGYMHINSENVIVEEINGEIVVTNLMSKSFPIIRYKLGDKITLAQDNFKCKCGRHHPVILDVLGRVGKNIIGYQNSYPSLTFYYVFKNLALNHDIILNYQAIQNERGVIILKIEQESPESKDLLTIELRKYFGSDISFEINFGAKLHTMEGKLKDFITTL
ncbi:phenylacetate--CoA ligase family protein [Flavobacterium sp. I3-2]|uniref:phenylacetate--CoA ligase family protein n=1 Tax=Flavobacterium sp. I3-2 TaxID=2748319 RepID=UPI0015B36B84|nr:phenylacetate--CoA ligase family protein [Flavobacterium sp. I3-2]